MREFECYHSMNIRNALELCAKTLPKEKVAAESMRMSEIYNTTIYVLLYSKKDNGVFSLLEPK